MKASLSLILSSLLLAACYGQMSHKCVSPQELEARVISVDHERDEAIFAKLSYDTYNKRTRIVDEIIHGKDKEYYDIINLHDEGVQYVINLHTKTCTKHMLTRPFVPIETPVNGTYLGSFYIGTSFPGYGVQVDGWSGVTSHGSDTYSTWTSKGCLPVHFSVYSKMYGHIRTEFMDVTFGISDPNVFSVPSQCYHKEKVNTESLIFRAWP